jgi:thioesterase domain-containing protein/acyl carrier protein
LKDQPDPRLAAFDVSLHAPDGSPLATFEGFCLRRVQIEAILHQASPQVPSEPTLAEAMLSCGLKGEDAPMLFERIFSGTCREMTVSSIAMSDLQRALAPAVPRTAARQAVSANAAADNTGLNPVERAIADVWRELLWVEKVGKDDDFFALGGHSLAAVRLFARIRKQFGVDLPLATLFQAPTLAALAALVESQREPEAAPALLSRQPSIVAGLAGSACRQLADDVTPQAASASKADASASLTAPVKQPWSPLVTICRGQPGSRPLFLVHGAGGNVLNFKIISDQLGPEQPVYGLQAQGVDGRLPAQTSIEAMAAQYVEAVRSVDPHGPYRLAGFSGGGVIAFEMAQQLVKAGASIALLGMIDTLCPTAARRPTPFLKHLWLLPRRSLKFVRERSERRRDSRLEPALATLVQQKMSKGEPLTPELVNFHLSRNYLEAQGRYQPQPYSGSLLLFRATQATAQYLAAGKRLGWEKCIQGDIRVTAVDSAHLSLMAMPGVAKVAEGFRKELALLEEIQDVPASTTSSPGRKLWLDGLLHFLSTRFKSQHAP